MARRLFPAAATRPLHERTRSRQVVVAFSRFRDQPVPALGFVRYRLRLECGLGFGRRGDRFDRSVHNRRRDLCDACGVGFRDRVGRGAAGFLDELPPTSLRRYRPRHRTSGFDNGSGCALHDRSRRLFRLRFDDRFDRLGDDFGDDLGDDLGRVGDERGDRLAVNVDRRVGGVGRFDLGLDRVELDRGLQLEVGNSRCVRGEDVLVAATREAGRAEALVPVGRVGNGSDVALFAEVVVTRGFDGDLGSGLGLGLDLDPGLERGVGCGDGCCCRFVDRKNDSGVELELGFRLGVGRGRGTHGRDVFVAPARESGCPEAPMAVGRVSDRPLAWPASHFGALLFGHDFGIGRGFMSGGRLREQPIPSTVGCARLGLQLRRQVDDGRVEPDGCRHRATARCP